MKKTILSLAATALVATSSFAIDTNDIYVGGGLSMVSLSGSGSDIDSGFAVVLNAGIPVLRTVEGSVLVEVELSQTVSPLSSTETDEEYNNETDEYEETYRRNLDIDVFSIALFAAYQYDITNEYFVKARLGLISQSMDDGSETYDDTGLVYGIQAGYNLSQTMGLYVGVDMNSVNEYIDAQTITLGANYHF